MTGESKTSDGKTYYAGCSKVAVTSDILKQNNWWVSKWKISVDSAKTDVDVAKILQTTYGPACNVGEKKESNGAGTYSVAIAGDGLDLSETKCPINFATANFFNPSKGKFAYWVLGQAVVFSSSVGNDSQYYDQIMEDSFKFL